MRADSVLSVLPLVLQDKGRMFREAFLNKLSLLLRGTVAAPADRFGETLADEHMMGGEVSPDSSRAPTAAILQSQQLRHPHAWPLHQDSDNHCQLY